MSEGDQKETCETKRESETRERERERETRTNVVDLLVVGRDGDEVKPASEEKKKIKRMSLRFERRGNEGGELDSPRLNPI